jgi:general secretion pathway protein A
LYNKYFHFSEQPFSIAPDPHFMFMSARHQEGLAHLLYGINRGGGFVALTGEVGTGKTTLCHCLLQQLPNEIDLALILNPKLNATELLAAICDELGIFYDKYSPSLKNLIDSLNQHLLDVHASGRRTVLLIDEAQNLSFEVLEQIRLLTNLETSKTKLLQIILVGQPELQKLLKRQDLRQLNQRITARYHLLPLSKEETRAYIRHRLTVCDGNPDLFKDSAIRKIFKFSSGIPRVINILCDRALLGAYSTNARLITAKIINNAAKESLIETDRGAPRVSTLITLIVVSCIVAAIYIVRFHPQALIKNKQPQPASVTKPVIKPEPIIKAPVQPEIQPPVEIKPVKPKIDFNTWINSPGLTLNNALQDSLKLWSNVALAAQPTDCTDIEALGLNCLSGKASLEKVLLMNSPIILELSLPTGEKRYALLIGIRQSQALVQMSGDLEFPLVEILKVWNGNYLIVWKPPLADLKAIYPGQSSNNVLWLRQQINSVNGTQEKSTNPQFFDKNLKKQVMEFQRQNHLFEDGIAGERTLFHLDNMTRSTVPHLKIND